MFPGLPSPISFKPHFCLFCLVDAVSEVFSFLNVSNVCVYVCVCLCVFLAIQPYFLKISFGICFHFTHSQQYPKMVFLFLDFLYFHAHVHTNWWNTSIDCLINIMNHLSYQLIRSNLLLLFSCCVLILLFLLLFVIQTAIYCYIIAIHCIHCYAWGRVLSCDAWLLISLVTLQLSVNSLSCLGDLFSLFLFLFLFPFNWPIAQIKLRVWLEIDIMYVVMVFVVWTLSNSSSI